MIVDLELLALELCKYAVLCGYAGKLIARKKHFLSMFSRLLSHLVFKRLGIGVILGFPLGNLLFHAFHILVLK